MHMILRASGIEEDSLAVVRNLLRLCGNFLHWLGNRFGRFLNLNGEIRPMRMSYLNGRTLKKLSAINGTVCRNQLALKIG